MPSSIDRLVRKEVSLGAIRELPVPEQRIGLQIAPFHSVDTDDVIFDYIKGGLQEGLAPARAEDAEAELGQKDDLIYGSGRAAIIDWAFKDKYTASDVTRYRDDLRLAQMLEGANTSLNFNSPARSVEQFNRRLARDDAARSRNLYNRLEWLVMSAIGTGKIEYNDGKIKFSVDYGRPTNQQNVLASTFGGGAVWGNEDSDPIGFILAEKQRLLDLTGVAPTRGILSTKIVNLIWKSNRFLAAVGIPVIGGTPNVPLDPTYLGLSGYTPEGALAIVERATGIKFTIYDGFYRTRPLGGTTYTNVRFLNENFVVLLPAEGDLGSVDDTEIGFAKMLTAPHPEGNWSSGFYEWEDESRDPWLHVRVSGVKAFPVFPYLEYTSVLNVLA